LIQRASLLARASAAARGSLGRHPDRAALLLIILAALGMRLAFTFRAPVFLMHDSITYFQAGYDFARGYGFELAFKRTPLYPLFIASVVWLVSEDLQALGFVQHLLGVFSAVLTYFLGRTLFGRTAGLVAGLLVALSGPLIIYEHYVLAEALFIPVLLGFALALVRAVRTASVRWFGLAGLLVGLAGLARPVGQAVLLVLPLVLFAGLRSWRRAAFFSLTLGVGFAAVTLPWMLRNYAQNGSLESAGALGQTLTGRITRHDEGFVIPSPDSPSPYTDPVRTDARALILRQMTRDARPSAINHRLRETYGWTEADANRAMRDVCLEILSEQKERYVIGTLVKARRLLWGEEEDFIGRHWGERKSRELRDDWLGNASIAHLLSPPSPLQEAEKYHAAAIVGLFSPHALRWPLLVLLLAGLAAGWRSAHRWAMAFILLVVLALILPAAALVGFVPRYRYPLDPFLAVLIGGGFAWLLSLASRTWDAAWRTRSPALRRPLAEDNVPATSSAGRAVT
jgi:4-amino-4-deoxy-L-arabinose transferase-like glycosyltransferase